MAGGRKGIMGTPARWVRRAAPFLLLAAVSALLSLPRAFGPEPSAAGTPHKVHLAFGFHVNLYHSFRGDTNDENGFGQDIRVIRRTLSELDRLNRAGIPVSAVWDFDNLFSLEEILPAHAPDIIHEVRRRVGEKRDEVILMSYNNGLLPAMEEDEFSVSIARAVSNARGSGVQDLFGPVAPVVRPQEMMTTAGHFERYARQGIRYVALYYSATPFDAFRVFSRELTPAEAHNPLRYRHPGTGEETVIIPTYHPGDLVEHVSLRDWALNLHRLQVEGEIDRDVLIFLNFDADAEFWAGIQLPWYLDWLPDTGGLGQMVESVADLDFVSFTRLGDYLERHPPAGTVHFSQDTADGSFHGYHSWAEKATVSDYWTRTLRNRRAHETARRVIALTGPGPMPPDLRDLLRESFETRLRVLSTTNFGLAGPFLTRQREAAMASLLDRLDACTARIHARLAPRIDSYLKGVAPPAALGQRGRPLTRILHLNRETSGAEAGDRSLALTLPAAESRGASYVLADTRGREIPAMAEKRRPQPDGRHTAVTLRVDKRHALPDGPYFLYRGADPAPAPGHPSPGLSADRRTLTNGLVTVRFDAHGRVTGVETRGGAAQLEEGSLVPSIRHAGRRLSPQRLEVAVEENGDKGVASVRLRGKWEGPPGVTRASGEVDLRLRLLGGVPYLFVDGHVRYPDTCRRTVVQPEKPMLARGIDAAWEEAAPLELRFVPRATRERPFFIHKRNYLGREGAYALDYFRHSPKNLNLASVNNHITAEYAGVTTGTRGMAVAMNTDASANFAFCPFTMRHLAASDEFLIRANPFGTYHGDQALPPTRGNRLGYDTVLLTAPQFHSAAPTYNGYVQRVDLMIAFFEGDSLPDDVKRDLIAFARPAIVLGPGLRQMPERGAVAPLPPDGLLALPYENGVLFHWEHEAEPGTAYRIRCRDLARGGETVFMAAITSAPGWSPAS